MRIRRFPPDSTSMRIDFAPASSAFSSSSFTTDAGRSTTSPAAILLATFSGSMRIRDINSSSTFLLVGPSFPVLLDLNSQIIKLRCIDSAWRLRHQILGLGGLREGDDV